MSDVTRLLEGIQHGDPRAAEELLPFVYPATTSTTPPAPHNAVCEGLCLDESCGD